MGCEREKSAHVVRGVWESPCKGKGILHYPVPVCCHLMIWCPAISTAGPIRLQLKRCRARVLATLDLGTGGRQLGVTEAVLLPVFHVQLHLIRRIPSEEGAAGGNCQSGTQNHGGLHCTRAC